MGCHSKQKGHLIHLNSLQGSAAEQSSDPNTLAHYIQTPMSLWLARMCSINNTNTRRDCEEG